LECSLQDEHYKKKAFESANGGKPSDDRQARKDKRKEELEKKTSEHLEKLNTENLAGAVIHLAGMAANATRELIKEKFNPFTKMPWIDFNKGDAEAWVRLNEANTAKDVLEKVLAAGKGKLVIGDKEVTSRLVEGEEEAQFWKEANEKRAAQRTKKGDRFGGNKRGGRGDKRNNRRGGQKRKHHRGQDDDSNDGEEQLAKKAKGTTAD